MICEKSVKQISLVATGKNRNAPLQEKSDAF